MPLSFIDGKVVKLIAKPEDLPNSFLIIGLSGEKQEM